MEKYRKVDRKTDADDGSPPDKSQVRVTQQANIRKVVAYASKLLKDEELGRVELRGMGKMIGKAITVCELLRRRIRDLHQQTKLSTLTIKDEYEPLEEGLDTVVTERTVSCISIFLSTDESKIEKGVGYSPPMNAAEFDEHQKEKFVNGKERGSVGESSNESRTDVPKVNGDVEEKEKEREEEDKPREEKPGEDKPGEDKPVEDKGAEEARRGGRRGRGRGRGRGRNRFRGRGRGRGRGGRGKSTRGGVGVNGEGAKGVADATATEKVNGDH